MCRGKLSFGVYRLSGQGPGLVSVLFVLRIQLLLSIRKVSNSKYPCFIRMRPAPGSQRSAGPPPTATQASPHMRGMDPQAEALPAGTPASAAAMPSQPQGVPNAAAEEAEDEVEVEHRSRRTNAAFLQPPRRP